MPKSAPKDGDGAAGSEKKATKKAAKKTTKTAAKKTTKTAAKKATKPAAKKTTKTAAKKTTKTAAKKTTKTAAKKTTKSVKEKPAETVEKATTKTKKAPRLRVLQTRSGIRHPWRMRRTLTALGLKHHQDEVVVPDNPSVRGMLQRVHHLVKVTPEDTNG